MINKGIRYVIITIDERQDQRNRHVKVDLLWDARDFVVTPDRKALTKRASKLILTAVRKLKADPNLIHETIRTQGLDMSPAEEKLPNGTRYRFTLVNGSEPFKKLVNVLNSNSKPRKEAVR